MTAIYVLANMAYLSALTPVALLSSDAIAVVRQLFHFEFVLTTFVLRIVIVRQHDELF